MEAKEKVSGVSLNTQATLLGTDALFDSSAIKSTFYNFSVFGDTVCKGDNPGQSHRC